MTTLTVNNPKINNKYLEHELNDDKIELCEILVEDLPKNTKERLKNIDNLNFINY